MWERLPPDARRLSMAFGAKRRESMSAAAMKATSVRHAAAAAAAAAAPAPPAAPASRAPLAAAAAGGPSFTIFEEDDASSASFVSADSSTDGSFTGPLPVAVRRAAPGAAAPFTVYASPSAGASPAPAAVSPVRTTHGIAAASKPSFALFEDGDAAGAEDVGGNENAGATAPRQRALAGRQALSPLSGGAAGAYGMAVAHAGDVELLEGGAPPSAAPLSGAAAAAWRAPPAGARDPLAFTIFADEDTRSSTGSLSLSADA
jgi:hypothetical protein